MKQTLYAIIVTILVATPLVVGATGFTVPTTEGEAAGLVNMTVFMIIARIMNWLVGLIGVLGVATFVVSGILYLTSAGDQEQTEKAKNIMLYSIIGMTVALIGFMVINVIGGITGGGGGADIINGY